MRALVLSFVFGAALLGSACAGPKPTEGEGDGGASASGGGDGASTGTGASSSTTGNPSTGPGGADCTAASGRPQGCACSQHPQCASNSCYDGFCCDVECSLDCEACAQSMTGSADGSCANVLQGMKDPDSCNLGEQACDGQGVCALANGQSCVASQQCASGYCDPNTEECADA